MKCLLVLAMFFVKPVVSFTQILTATNSVPFLGHVSNSYGISKSCLLSDLSDEQEKDGEEPAEDETSGVQSTSDILNSPSFLKRKVEVLKSDIENLDDKIQGLQEVYEIGKEEWGSQLDDLEKEYQTIQERIMKQSEGDDGTETIEVARKVLEVLDNFDRAFGIVTPTTDAEKEIETSYKNTYSMILDTFEKLGIKEVETLGTEFDYEVHQAMMSRPSDEYEEGIVCDEFAKGYVTKDGKLIRAAMVSVAA